MRCLLLGVSATCECFIIISSCFSRDCLFAAPFNIHYRQARHTAYWLIALFVWLGIFSIFVSLVPRKDSKRMAYGADCISLVAVLSLTLVRLARLKCAPLAVMGRRSIWRNARESACTISVILDNFCARIYGDDEAEPSWPSSLRVPSPGSTSLEGNSSSRRSYTSATFEASQSHA